jgi:hypothetical protein
MSFKMCDKGGVSIYGLGRFPVTLYYEQWVNLLDRARRTCASFLKPTKTSLS